MSKAEILAELPKLTAAEREEIRLRLAELDAVEWQDQDDPLTDAEKALIESRLAEHYQNPGSAVPLEEMKSRLRARLDKAAQELDAGKGISLQNVRGMVGKWVAK